jgi:hypothetical protein
MFLGRVLVWVVAVGHARMVVLVLVAGSEVRPVLAAAEIVRHMRKRNLLCGLASLCYYGGGQGV